MFTDTRQAATLLPNFFVLFHFDVELVVRQRDKNHAISRNCTCTIFTASSPGIKKCLK